jgi:hemolysin III
MGKIDMMDYNIIDHNAIYLMIAGSYTPFTLVVLRNQGYWGWTLFAVIWFAAIAGVFLSFYNS